jgi:hypothetical protein
MISISIALIIIATIAGWLVNRYLDQRELELTRKYELNKLSAQADISAAIEESLKRFDSRINDTWSTISDVKQELNAFKLQVGMRKI